MQLPITPPAIAPALMECRLVNAWGAGWTRVGVAAAVFGAMPVLVTVAKAMLEGSFAGNRGVDMGVSAGGWLEPFGPLGPVEAPSFVVREIIDAVESVFDESIVGRFVAGFMAELLTFKVPVICERDMCGGL